jgi:hypothetical protein
MSDFELGEQYCHSGIPAREDASDLYIEGYGLRYETEAIDNHNLDNFEEMWKCL